MIALNPKTAIASQIAAGKSVADMAKSMGVSTQTIYRRIDAFGLQLPRRLKYQHVPHGRDLMRELEAGATIAQLSAAAGAWGVPRQTLFAVVNGDRPCPPRILAALGLEKVPSGRRLYREL